MKILHITSKPYNSTYGGLEIYLQYLLAAQVSRGNEVFIASILFGDKNDEMILNELPSQAEIRIFEIYLPERYRNSPESEYDNLLNRHLQVLLSTIHPDICHCHHGFATQVILVCKAAKIKTVYTIHCSEIFCINGLLLKHGRIPCDGICNEKKCLACCADFLPVSCVWRGLLCFLPRFMRKWIETRIHKIPFIYFLTPLFTGTRLLCETIRHQTILSQTDAVVAPSHAVADLAQRQVVDFNNIHVILHGIPEVSPLPFPAFDSRHTVHFYYVGRICSYKGIHLLLEAFSRLQHDNWTLHLIGDAALGIEKKYASALKRKYPDRRLFWHGKVPHDDLPQTIAGCHIMVHPAMFFEIFGLTIAEALAYGRPVIATRCGGPESQIVDGINGWLVERNSVDALSQQIERILVEPASVLAIQRNCKKNSFGQHLDALMNLYQSIECHL